MFLNNGFNEEATMSKQTGLAQEICTLTDNISLKQQIAVTTPEVQQCIADLCRKINKLSEIGAALSAERNLPKLLQMILEEARAFTRADGGTLYMMNDDGQSMRFEIVQTDSLGIRMGGISGNPINWYPVRLYLADGTPNHAMVSAHVGITGETVNIPDVYDVEGFDFTGTRAFDAKTGYRSQSMLVVPMRNHENEIIGVLQLLNAQDPLAKASIPFSAADERLIASLASQAAVAITNTQLIHDLENLLESFIQVIASAIDEKSPYTGGHIERVAMLTMQIAEMLNSIDEEPFAELNLNADQLKELRMAAWMHDIGKITTPEYVVDKSTKLETIYDRIHTVQARLEILKRDAQIDYLKKRLKIAEGQLADDGGTLEANFKERLRQIESDAQFLRQANIGGEFMAKEHQERVHQIAAQEILIGEEQTPLLTANEVQNLNIPRGTLSNEERQIINNHVAVTIKMLEKLPFPKKLRHVPEYAGGHHEKLDGTGYPKGLTDKDLSPQAKMMALADIFEALTARDRPYKKGKTLSEAMRIMGFMAKDKHIDPVMFELFKRHKMHLQYAREYMDPSQIDTDE